MKRKHWTEYNNEHIGYGQFPGGFGVYHLYEDEYWLDWECATDYEKKEYKKWLKKKGYDDDEGQI